MCGIIGIYCFDEPCRLSEKLLESARDTMSHRGPDDAGLRLFEEGPERVGLGHRRLSILDLSQQGHQPMSTVDGRLWIVFNGEIFNYRELREVLERLGGYRFRSHTDTEVILNAVRHWGLEESLRRFRGMYAFALYDRDTATLTLVRDPLGVKPLYFCPRAGFLAFASEIKALLSLPGVERKLNEQALYHYLTFANAPAPLTLFQGVEKLEAGTYMVISRGGGRKRVRFWDPAVFQPEVAHMDEEETAQELRRLLRQAVARRMVSDVPVGVFLSGGVDSSLNVALMAELSAKPVQTFSIGIAFDPANEFLYARKVAESFGANHHEVVIGESDFIDFLPQMAFYQDEPLADPVCVPLYYVSGLARRAGVPVIQVGEGSDEIFAGYGAYHLFNRIDRLAYRHLLWSRGLLRPVIRSGGASWLSAEKEDMLRRAAEGSPLFLGNAIAFWDCEKIRLMKNGLREVTSSRHIRSLTESLGVADPLARIIQVELKNRLPELLLMRVDKMSMAHSIETRVPFLDEDLVEFALKIPSSLKFKNGEPKYILKKTAEGILPEEIIYRKKWGFCGSATNMLTDGILAFARETITASPIVQEMFDHRQIDAIFERHHKQKRFNSFKIWNLMNLALWHQTWFHQAGHSCNAGVEIGLV